MTLKFDSLAMAEGAVADSRGNFTLVSYNPQVLVVNDFPTPVAPALLAVVEDREEPRDLQLGDSVGVRFNVTDPDGDTVFFAENTQVINDFPQNDLPRRLTIMAQIPFTVNKAGDYLFNVRFSLTAKAISLEESRRIRVSSSPTGTV